MSDKSDLFDGNIGDIKFRYTLPVMPYQDGKQAARLFVALNKKKKSKTLFQYLINFIFLLGLAFIAMMWDQLFQQYGFWIKLSLVFIAGMYFGSIQHPVYPSQKAKRHDKSDSPEYCEIIEIGEYGLRQIRPLYVIIIKWEFVKSVVSNDRYTFIFTNEGYLGIPEELIRQDSGNLITFISNKVNQH